MESKELYEEYPILDEVAYAFQKKDDVDLRAEQHTLLYNANLLIKALEQEEWDLLDKFSEYQITMDPPEQRQEEVENYLIGNIIEIREAVRKVQEVHPKIRLNINGFPEFMTEEMVIYLQNKEKINLDEIQSILFFFLVISIITLSGASSIKTLSDHNIVDSYKYIDDIISYSAVAAITFGCGIGLILGARFMKKKIEKALIEYFMELERG